MFSYNLKTGAYEALYLFTGGLDGGQPIGAMVLGPAGNLYGTASYGGLPNEYWGIVFELDPTTKMETVLHTFAAGTDGAFPYGGVIQSYSGTLYGTTVCGGDTGNSICAGLGTDGYGTVFELAKGHVWTETVLHSFAYSDGAYPSSGVIIDSNRHLFGVADAGGSGGGVVWEITLP